MTRIEEILSRQQVERVLPQVPWWSKVAVWFGILTVSWIGILLFIGGILFWLDALDRWWR